VPRQESSGGKPRLMGISQRCDTYRRTLLIHGARARWSRSPPARRMFLPSAAAILL